MLPHPCLIDKSSSLQDFAEAKKSRRYVVKVYIDAYGGESERIANKETSEMLLIRRGTHGMSYVEVERLSTAEKK